MSSGRALKERHFITKNVILMHVSVINAAHTFYSGTTSVPIDHKDPASRKRKTNTLNTTTNPEEKRKIIGDTFMRVFFGLVNL